MSTGDPLVVISRSPRDNQRARVRLSALDAFALDSFSDGTRSKVPLVMLVASVAPADIAGKIRRGAPHDDRSDRVRVAIPRTQNQVIFPAIERAAASRPLVKVPPPPRKRTRTNAPPIPVPVPASKVLDVAAIRARCGMSAAALAAWIGVSRASVHAWETGRCAPRPDSREHLMRVDRDGLNPGDAAPA